VSRPHRYVGMRLYVIGGSGRTGQHLIDQAIARGHDVTALVRRENALRPQDHLQLIMGDASRPEDVAAFLDGHDAVLSCLGHRRHADTHLLHDAADALLDAMACTGVSRCMFVSQALLFASHNPLTGLLRLVLANHVADSTAMEHLIELSDTDWTIVRPPRLRDGGTPHGYKVEAGALPGGSLSLERADLAAFMLDAVENHQYPRAIVGVTSAAA
jgi:putative NADH-flavin reductase